MESISGVEVAINRELNSVSFIFHTSESSDEAADKRFWKTLESFSYVHIDDRVGMFKDTDWASLFAEPSFRMIDYECAATRTRVCYNMRLVVSNVEHLILHDCDVHISNDVELNCKRVELHNCTHSDKETFLAKIAPHVEDLRMTGMFSSCPDGKLVFPKLCTLQCDLSNTLTGRFITRNFPALENVLGKEPSHGWLFREGRLWRAQKDWLLVSACKTVRNMQRDAKVVLYLSLRKTTRLPKDVIKMVCSFIRLSWFQASCDYVADMIFDVKLDKFALAASGGITQREFATMHHASLQISDMEYDLKVTNLNIRDVENNLSSRKKRGELLKKRAALIEEEQMLEDQIAANQALIDTFVKRRKIKSRK